MKKTLLAVAALAATSGVFAQSSVTLYGVVDASLEAVKGEDTVTRVQSGNLVSSRVGIKGQEALGDGLNAKFALESKLSNDTGAAGGGARFFDRAAWVGLQGGFGELRLGRIDTSIGAIASVLGAQDWDDLKLAGTRAGNSHRRADNAITYLLPAFAKGLNAELQFTPNVNGNEDGDKTGQASGLNVRYKANGFDAGLGYVSVRDQAAAAGKQSANATLAYLGYDFGPAKLTGYYNNETASVAAIALGNDDRLQLYGAKLDVPFGDNFVLSGSVSKAKNLSGGVGDDEATFGTVQGVYTLSKRTSLYAKATIISNGDDSSIGLVTTGAGDKSHGLALGVVHRF